MTSLHQTETARQAVVELQQALDQLPSRQRLSDADIQAIYALAYTSVAQGRFEDARDQFSLLTLYRPTHPACLAGLALSDKLLRRYGEAQQVFAFLAVLEPANPAHSIGLAECQLLAGEYDAALSTLGLVQAFCEENAGHARSAARAQALMQFLSPGAPPAR